MPDVNICVKVTVFIRYIQAPNLVSLDMRFGRYAPDKFLFSIMKVINVFSTQMFQHTKFGQPKLNST